MTKLDLETQIQILEGAQKLISKGIEMGAYDSIVAGKHYPARIRTGLSTLAKQLGGDS
jgi:hypothetical protein